MNDIAPSGDSPASIPTPVPDSSPHDTILDEETRAYAGGVYGSGTQHLWDDRWFHIKVRFLNTLSRVLLWLSVIALFAVAGLVAYLIGFILIHYTIPGVAWLKPEELARLERGYTRVSAVVAPFVLISNAWLIWMASRRGRKEPSARDGAASP